MDRKGIGNMNNNGSRSPYDDTNSPPSKRTCYSLPTRLRQCWIRSEGGSGAVEHGFAEFVSSTMAPIVKELVRVEMIKAFETYFPPHLLESLRKGKGTGEEVTNEGGIGKYKLVFLNEPAAVIFTNNEIKAENGEPLQVAIIDATTNATIRFGLVASVQVEFFLLDGDYGGSGEQQHRHPLSARDGKRPLVVGSDLNLTLQYGVASIHSLIITDNSSWMKSKKFRLAVKVKGDKMFQPISIGVSQPFRVMDHRGEVNKKHHPPSSEDEVWRLEGIGKDGAYHKNLTYNDIKNVGDFLKAYEKNGTNLKKLLGNKVPQKIWEMMIANAKECVKPPTYEQIPKVNDQWPYKVIMGSDESFFNQDHEICEEKNNLGEGSSQISGMEVFGEDFEFVHDDGGFSPWVLVEGLRSYPTNDIGQKG
ncbi:hypothetical protein IC575_003190 [Cucumis melo]